jgi:hypothetical protein
MRKIPYKSYLRFARLTALAGLLGGCGGECNVFQTAVGDAGCRKLALSGNRAFTGTKASCAGTASSRKLQVNCPPSAGTASHCTSQLNGFPVFSLLVSNNAGGAFQDNDGTVYTTCQDLLTAYNSGSLINVTGVYISDSTLAGDTVSCTDAGGCTMTSQNCYAGWDHGGGALSGTASIPLGSSVLSCTYIDTTALGGPASIAVNTWASAPPQFAVNGDLSFTSGWVDAQ